MAKKERDGHNPEEFWAQQIYRTSSGGQGYIAALVRRKYSNEDVEKKGLGTYIGLKEEVVRDMITDNDPDSETFGKRIPDPNDDGSRKKFKFIDTDDVKTVAQYKKLFGITNYGTTILTYKFRERTFEAPNFEYFFNTPIEEVYRKFILEEKGLPSVAEPIPTKPLTKK